MPQIKLLKGTMVDGTYREEGWEGKVSDKTYKTLLSSKKISPAEKEEEVSVNLSIDIENTEAFKELSDAYASLIVAKDDAENKLEDANNYVLQLNSDIHSMNLKELRAKYPLEEQGEEQSNES